MFFSSKKVIGLDIGTSSIKLAEVDASRGSATLSNFGIYPLPPGSVVGGEIVDSVVVSQAIAELVRSTHAKRKNTATAMWGTSVIVKKISMPRMEEQLVAEQIKWEAEQYIPFDVNEISLEYHILKQQRGQADSMDVLLVAAKQEFVFRFIEVIEAAGLKTSIVDVAGFALANCFEHNYGAVDGVTALLNFGASVTNLVVVDRGEVIFSRDIPVGGSQYTFDIHKEMGVNLDEAEALKVSASLRQEVPQEVHNLINTTNEAVVDEIRNSFEFFGATAGGSNISRVYVTGGSMFVPGLLDLVAKAVGLAYNILDPFARVGYRGKSLSPDYLNQLRSIASVAVGLGLRKEGDR